MALSQKLFTVEEANAILPQLRRHVPRIRGLAAALQSSCPLGGDRDQAVRSLASSGGTLVPHTYFLGLLALRSELAALDALGVILKDLEEGLVDFLHMREGKVVFLCWRLGEAEVRFWHEVGAGYDARKPLP